MYPERFWIVAGICIGVTAGLLGAYVAWRRSQGACGRGFTAATATITLILAVGAAVTVLSVRASWEHRMCLLLAPGFLVYWFVDQVRAIRRYRDCEGHDSGHEV